MKARRFLAVVLTVTLVLLGLGVGAWWMTWQRSPLQLQHQALSMPRAARFVPRDAPFSAHLLADPEQPLAYARAVAPVRQRRQAVEAVAGLRDGAFAAAGLDYIDELANWLGDETSLWMFQGDPAKPVGWVLALSSRDGDGARRFLQRFWQTRSLAGTDLQISNYRGMGLISGRGALVGEEPVPLATALIDDDLVLLASGRGVLEQSLDVSQIDALNQASDPQLQQRIQSVAHGALVLTAQPDVFQGSLLGPLSPSLHSIMVALRPEGRDLVVDGWLDPGPSVVPWPVANSQRAMPLLDALQGEATALAVLQAPGQWPAPWPAAMQALIRQGSTEDLGPVPALVLDTTEGSLLWRQDEDGWLLGTASEQPDRDQLAQGLAAMGLVSAPLEVEGDVLEVWTRFLLGRDRPRDDGGPDQLVVSLAAASSVQDGWTWWANSIQTLRQQRQGHAQPRALTERLETLELPEASLRWVASAEPAQALLHQWSAWRVLSALAGVPLAPPVDGMALALQPDQKDVRVRARLSYGH